MKKFKQNIGNIFGSIAAALVLTAIVLMLALVCVLIIKTILSVVGL